MATSINAHDKKTICRAFVIDVLTNRVKALADARVKLLTKQVAKVLTPELLEDVATLKKIEKKYSETPTDVWNMFNLELENWNKKGNDKMVTELEADLEDIEVQLDFTFNSRIALNEFGVEREVKIPTPVPVPANVNDDDWMYVVTNGGASGVKADKKLVETENKLTVDARRLYGKAMESLKNIRTLESLEKNVPELIPYTRPSGKDEIKDLADLASCMRSKNNC